MENQVPGSKDTTAGRRGPVVDLVGFRRRLFLKVATTVPPLAGHYATCPSRRIPCL